MALDFPCIRALGLTRLRTLKPKDKILTFAIGVISLVGLTIAALDWRGKSLFPSRFASFFSKAGVIGGLLTVSFAFYSYFTCRTSSPSENPLPSSPCLPPSQVQSSTSSSPSMPSSTPSSSSMPPKSSSVFSSSSPSCLGIKPERFNAMNLSQQVNEYFIQINSLNGFLQAPINPSSAKPIDKESFSERLNALTKEFSEFLAIKIKDLNLNEIKNLSDVTRCLGFFSTITSRANYNKPDKERKLFLEGCSSVKDLAITIKVYLDQYCQQTNELADEKWKDCLWFLATHDPKYWCDELTGNLGCIFNLDFADNIQSMRRIAISNFWESFFSKLADSENETLVQDLESFISLAIKVDLTFTESAAGYFSDKFKGLETAKKQRLSAIGTGVKESMQKKRSLISQERELLYAISMVI